MPNPVSEILNDVTGLWPVSDWRDFSVLVAVSGGADSVALLHAVQLIHRQYAGLGSVFVAHVNHRLRGQASDADAVFVSQLAGELELPCIVETLPAPNDDTSRQTSNRGIGLEAGLRKRRYEILTRIAAERGARYLLTGHTRDDQVETILFRLMRGTGFEGLKGIPERRVSGEHLTIVRPLLNVTRNRIVSFLNHIGQDWRDDETNSSSRFTRNRLRHEALPMLRETFGNDIDQSLLGLSAIAMEHSQLLERLTAPILERHFTIGDRRVSVSLSGLGSQDPLLVKVAARRAWKLAGFPERDMTQEKWNRLASRLHDRNGTDQQTEVFPGGVHVSREPGVQVWRCGGGPA